MKNSVTIKNGQTIPGLFGKPGCTANSYPNAYVPSKDHFYDGLWYDPAGTRNHDLPHERRIR